jgi:hypothetical protein
VGFFQHSKDDSDQGGETASASSEAEQVAAELEHFSRLALPERAAEVLTTIAPAIEHADDYMGMGVLLKSWLPDSDWMSWSPEQRKTWFSLQLVLQEAFHALVLTRMLIPRESEYKGATEITYALGPDAGSAQQRGDVAEVVGRRLPD